MYCYERFPRCIVRNAMQSVFIPMLKSPPLEMELLLGVTRLSRGTFILHLYLPLLSCMVSRSVMSDSLQPHGLLAHQASLSMGFPR